MTFITESRDLDWTLRADRAEVADRARLNFRSYLKVLDFLNQFSLVVKNIEEEFPDRQFIIVISGKDLKVRIADQGSKVSVLSDLEITAEEEELMYRIVSSIVYVDYSGNGIFTLKSESVPYIVNINRTDKWSITVGPLSLHNPDIGFIDAAIAQVRRLISEGVTSF